MDCSRQASLSMGFSGQENWSGLLFTSPGGLPDPGMEPTSPALAGRSFTVEAPGRLKIGCYAMKDLNTKKWISLLKTRPGRTGWPECPDQRAGTPRFPQARQTTEAPPSCPTRTQVLSICSVAEGTVRPHRCAPHRSCGSCVWVGEQHAEGRAPDRKQLAHVKQDTSKNVWRQFSNISVNYVQIIDSSRLVFKTDFPGLLLYNIMSALTDYWNQL